MSGVDAFRFKVATRMVGLIGLGCLLVLAAAVRPSSASAETYPTGFNPANLPTASCFWTGPFTREDPVTNVAFPGT